MNIAIRTEEENKPTFYIKEGDTELGEMNGSIEGNMLTVTHTEVNPEAQGKGVAKALLDGMVKYARENNLQVKPMCSYVQTQFKRNPDSYKDICPE